MQSPQMQPHQRIALDPFDLPPSLQLQGWEAEGGATPPPSQQSPAPLASRVRSTYRAAMSELRERPIPWLAGSLALGLAAGGLLRATRHRSIAGAVARPLFMASVSRLVKALFG